MKSHKKAHFTGGSLLDRFTGPDGHRRLIQLLRAQRLVGDTEALAERFADSVNLRELSSGELLIKQGAADNDLYLILSGSVSVQVNEREVATRGARIHVGEMAMVDPSAPRSATIVAREPTVVACLTESVFSDIASEHPALWRCLALDLCDRLRERQKFHRLPNQVPIAFIGSSREALPVAKPIRDGIASKQVITRLWTDGVFGASKFPMEDLESQLQESDFAVLVAAADDQVSSRGRDSGAPRDNVVFELGLFMGALTRTRTFLVVPHSFDLKIPTDILGMTPLTYALDSAGVAQVAAVCEELQCVIAELGPK